NSREVPVVARPPAEPEQPERIDAAAFLLIPASDAGKTYGEEAQRVVSHLHLVRVPGQADLMFCRELGQLTPIELERILGPCRTAYEATTTSPNTSAHARFDVTDWIPLEP